MTHLGPSLRRTRKRERAGGRLAVGVALSLALNLSVLQLLDRDWLALRTASNELRPVSLRPLAPGAWAANRRIAAGARPAPPDRGPLPRRVRPPPEAEPSLPAAAQARPAPPPPKPEPSRSDPAVEDVPAGKQVVDIEATGKPEPPKDTRFVGETDNTVEKETVSRFARSGYQRTLAKPAQAEAPAQGPPTPAEKVGTPGSTARGRPAGDGLRPGAPGAPAAPRVAPEPRRPAPRDLAMRLDAEGLRKDFRAPAAPAPAAQRATGQGGEGGEAGDGAERGDGGERGAGALRSQDGQPILKPSAAFYDKLSGGPFADYLQGVDVGDSTVLNTKAWAHAGYMNRVKAAVAEAWDPGPEARARDPRGDRFFYKDRATVVRVTLDEKGALKEVRVAQSSGLDFLDQLGVEAFQRAQPFHNPPSALIGPQGEFQFFFTFVMVGGPAR